MPCESTPRRSVSSTHLGGGVGVSRRTCPRREEQRRAAGEVLRGDPRGGGHRTILPPLFATIIAAESLPCRIEAKYAISDPPCSTRWSTCAPSARYISVHGRARRWSIITSTPRTADLLKARATRAVSASRRGRVRWLLTVKGLSKGRRAVHERERIRMRRAPESAPHELARVSRPRDRPRGSATGGPSRELFVLRQLRVHRAVEDGERAVGELSLAHRERRHRRHKTLTRELEIELGPSGTREDLEAALAQSSSRTRSPCSAVKVRAGPRPPGRTRGHPQAQEEEALGCGRMSPWPKQDGRSSLPLRAHALQRGRHPQGEDIEALSHMRVATRRQRGVPHRLPPR